MTTIEELTNQTIKNCGYPVEYSEIYLESRIVNKIDGERPEEVGNVVLSLAILYIVSWIAGRCITRLDLDDILNPNTERLRNLDQLINWGLRKALKDKAFKFKIKKTEEDLWKEGYYVLRSGLLKTGSFISPEFYSELIKNAKQSYNLIELPTDTD